MKKIKTIISICVMSLMCSVVYGQEITTIDRSKRENTTKKEDATSTKKTRTSTQTKKKRQQTTKKKGIVFSISSNSAQFGASGGSHTFTINASSSWSIHTQPDDWGHLTRTGNKLTLRVDANPKASNRTDYFVLQSGDKTQRVDISQLGETIFSISSNTAQFDAAGGSQAFTISANDIWNIKVQPNSWGHLTREGNMLTLRVDANSMSSDRTDYFELVSGTKTLRVNITQTGVTALSVSSQTLNFSSSGGTQTINVSTNSSWEISLGTASWGHLTKNGNQLTVRIDANSGTALRTDYFKIKAGDKIVQVNISQSGASYSSYHPSTSYSYSGHRGGFNLRKDHYWGGISVGYIQKQWTYDTGGKKEKMGMFDDDKYLQGVQAGLRIDPQFGLGFGMNTGIFYEYCWAKSKAQADLYSSYHYTYKEHGLYLPLDLKYTMNFSKWFQLSFYGGVGFNYVLSGKVSMREDGETYDSEDVFSDHDNMEKLNMMLEYGASVRISAFQIDFSMSQGLNDWSDVSGVTIKQGRPMMISATLCF